MPSHTHCNTNNAIFRFHVPPHVPCASYEKTVYTQIYANKEPFKTKSDSGEIRSILLFGRPTKCHRDQSFQKLSSPCNNEGINQWWYDIYKTKVASDRSCWPCLSSLLCFRVGDGCTCLSAESVSVPCLWWLRPLLFLLMLVQTTISWKPVQTTVKRSSKFTKKITHIDNIDNMVIYNLVKYLVQTRLCLWDIKITNFKSDFVCEI